MQIPDHPTESQEAMSVLYDFLAQRCREVTPRGNSLARFISPRDVQYTLCRDWENVDAVWRPYRAVEGALHHIGLLRGTFCRNESFGLFYQKASLEETLERVEYECRFPTRYYHDPLWTIRFPSQRNSRTRLFEPPVRIFLLPQVDDLVVVRGAVPCPRLVSTPRENVHLTPLGRVRTLYFRPHTITVVTTQDATLSLDRQNLNSNGVVFSGRRDPVEEERKAWEQNIPVSGHRRKKRN